MEIKSPDELGEMSHVLEIALAKLFKHLGIHPVEAIPMIMLAGANFTETLFEDGMSRGKPLTDEDKTAFTTMAILSYLTGMGLLTDDRYNELMSNVDNVRIEVVEK